MTQPVYNPKTDTWDYGTDEKAAQARLDKTRRELRDMLSGSAPFHEDPNTAQEEKPLQKAIKQTCWYCDGVQFTTESTKRIPDVEDWVPCIVCNAEDEK